MKLTAVSAFTPVTQKAAAHYTPAGSPKTGLYTGLMPHAEPLHDETPAQLALLVENHRAFLRYLERRVGDRALAEDILQDAFAKVIDHPERAPADEGVVPWFYRMLRNAAIDQFRRRGAASRAADAFARELDAHAAPEPELEAAICACVTRLAGDLEAGIRRGAPGDRRRGHAGQGVRRAAWLVGQQRGRARVPGARGA